MSKQNLWFLTLFSLILVLSVYYITMPNDLLISNKKDEKVVSTKNEKTKIEETSSLVAMRVSLEEERQNEMDVLQELLTNEASSAEKNNAYEKLKYLNELQGKEEEIEKEIKKTYNNNCFVKIDNSNVNVVCVADKHDSTLANNIMRLVQKSYKNKMFTTVKFQKS